MCVKFFFTESHFNITSIAKNLKIEALITNCNTPKQLQEVWRGVTMLQDNNKTTAIEI
jgi:hypothetical protein